MHWQISLGKGKEIMPRFFSPILCSGCQHYSYEYALPQTSSNMNSTSWQCLVEVFHRKRDDAPRHQVGMVCLVSAREHFSPPYLHTLPFHDLSSMESCHHHRQYHSADVSNKQPPRACRLYPKIIKIHSASHSSQIWRQTRAFHIY